MPDQKTASDRKSKSPGGAGHGLVYLRFDFGPYDGGRLEVEQHNDRGDRLTWVVSVESK